MIRVRMRIERTWQNGGLEMPLQVGQVYELPDVIACAFLATGVADRVADADEGRQLRDSSEERPTE